MESHPGVEFVSLGSTVLRAETAGIVALAGASMVANAPWPTQ